MLIQHTQTSTITPPPPHLQFEEEPDTCPTCRGKKTVDGKLCPTCVGTGDMDCVPFACEEVDADELPHDDLDGLGDTETGSVEVSVPCPCCGKQITITISPEQVH